MEPIVLDIKALNIPSLLPMIVTVLGAIFLLCIDLGKKKLEKGFFVTTTIFVLLIDLFLVFNYSSPTKGFFDVMLVDGLSVLSQIVVLLGSILFITLSLTKASFEELELSEYYAIFLFMISGFQFMVSSDNLILIFVGLETSSLAIYTLIALHNREKSLEAAIKYFTLGGFAAGLFAFGCMIFYAITGSIEINQIKDVLISSNFDNTGMILLGSSFLLAALGFKLSLVPMHTWAPDVYEGAPAALAGFISIVPKIAGLVVTIRIFEFLAQSPDGIVHTLLWIACVVTMTFGNLLAIVQDGVKRMLAYSSVSHAGFVMSAILIGTTDANSSLFLYWFLFLFTNLGAFSMLWMTRDPKVIWDKRYDHPFNKFSGLVYSSPLSAILMGIFMLSLAGIPPLALYWGKIFLISSAIKSGYIFLGLIMVLNSAIAVYYYLKLIIYMFLKPKEESAGTIHMEDGAVPLKIILGISGVSVVSLFLFIDPLMNYITMMVKASGY